MRRYSVASDANRDVIFGTKIVQADQPAVSEIWHCSSGGFSKQEVKGDSSLNLEMSERDKHSSTDAMLVRADVIEKCLDLQKALFNPEINEATAEKTDVGAKATA